MGQAVADDEGAAPTGVDGRSRRFEGRRIASGDKQHDGRKQRSHQGRLTSLHGDFPCWIEHPRRDHSPQQDTNDRQANPVPLDRRSRNGKAVLALQKVRVQMSRSRRKP